jgi:hypothetical protein
MRYVGHDSFRLEEKMLSAPCGAERGCLGGLELAGRRLAAALVALKLEADPLALLQ